MKKVLSLKKAVDSVLTPKVVRNESEWMWAQWWETERAMDLLERVKEAMGVGPEVGLNEEQDSLVCRLIEAALTSGLASGLSRLNP